MDDKALAITNRWISNLASVTSHSLRFGLWCDLLSRQKPALCALLLDNCAKLARRDDTALKAYLAFIDYPTLTQRVGAGKLSEILMAARKLDLHAATMLLEYQGEPQVPDDFEPSHDPITYRLSLGHKKTFARGPRTPVMDRLLKDPDPRVVAQTLVNPRLREREVVSIASRRPSEQAVFWEIARTGRWVAQLAVRRAIVQNPSAPPRLANALMVTLAQEDLNMLLENTKLHPSVRDGVLEVMSWENA